VTEQQIIDAVKKNNLNFMDVFVSALALHLNQSCTNHEDSVDLYLKAVKDKWNIKQRNPLKSIPKIDFDGKII
jgi:hypothetical protein